MGGEEGRRGGIVDWKSIKEEEEEERRDENNII